MKLSTMIKFSVRFVEYRFNRVHPMWCAFAISENCNASCEYCQYWRKKYSNMSTESALKVIDKLKDLGVVSIVFSGGECLLRSDMAEIVSYTTKSGIRSSLTTNGLIYNEKLFYDLMSNGLRVFTFSLDGSNATIHESFRRGCSFNTVIQSIRKAIEIRNVHRFHTRIATTTVVNKTNIDDLHNIFHLRKSLGVDMNLFQPIWNVFGEENFNERFSFANMQFKDLQKVTGELTRIPDGNLRRYFEILPYLYGKFEWIADRYQCFAGRAFVYVDSAGNLFPCSPLSHQSSIGSLLEESIHDILSKPELKNKLNEYKQFKCGGCTMTCYMEKNIVLSSLHNPISIWKRTN